MQCLAVVAIAHFARNGIERLGVLLAGHTNFLCSFFDPLDSLGEGVAEADMLGERGQSTHNFLQPHDQRHPPTPYWGRKKIMA